MHARSHHFSRRRLIGIEMLFSPTNNITNSIENKHIQPPAQSTSKSAQEGNKHEPQNANMRAHYNKKFMNNLEDIIH